MKEKIEYFLNTIMEDSEIDENGKEVTQYFFTGDGKGDSEECSHDVSLKVLMNYFIYLENQTNLIVKILKDKAIDPNMSMEEAMDVVTKMDQIIDRMEM